MKLITILVLVIVACMATAQQTIGFNPVWNAGKPGQTLYFAGKGVEAWWCNIQDSKISSYELDLGNGSLKIGDFKTNLMAYTGWNSDFRLTDGGVYGFGSVPLNKQGLLLAGPWYVFLSENGQGRYLPKTFTPNLRLTTPIDKDVRVGLSMRAAWGDHQAFCLIGPYIAVTKGNTTLQVRYGEYLSGPQSGKQQLWMFITNKF